MKKKEDEDGDPQMVRQEIKRTQDEWNEKEAWYHNDFQIKGKEYSWNTVRDNYINELKKILIVMEML